MRSVIIYGAEEAGRAEMANGFARLFGLKTIVHWDGEPFGDGTLVITDRFPPFEQERQAIVMHIGQAKACLAATDDQRLRVISKWLHQGLDGLSHSDLGLIGFDRWYAGGRPLNPDDVREVLAHLFDHCVAGLKIGDAAGGVKGIPQG